MCHLVINSLAPFPWLTDPSPPSLLDPSTNSAESRSLSLAAPEGLQRHAVLALRHQWAAASSDASPSPASLQRALSCNGALLAAGSPLERELAGWQAAALANAVLRALQQPQSHVEDRRRESRRGCGREREATDAAEAGGKCGQVTGALAEAVLGKVGALAEAAGLGPGLGLLAALLARAALAVGGV